MKRIVCALATSAVAVTLMAGTAAAEGVDESWTPPTCVIDEEPAPDSDDETMIVDRYSDEKPITCDDDEGGAYPPAPIQVWLPNPVVDYGQGLMVKGKGLCSGIPAVFAVQSASDWTVRTFSPEQYVAEDGTSWYKFSPSELAGLYGPVTVYVKQSGECEGSATTTATINKKAPAPAPTPTQEPTPAPTPDKGVVPQTPAPAAVPTAVLSGGAAAAAGVTPIVSPAATTAAAAAPAAPAQSSLPATGASTDLAQLALVALATGLGLMTVASSRRRAAGARTR